MSSELKEEVKH